MNVNTGAQSFADPRAVIFGSEMIAWRRNRVSMPNVRWTESLA
jgi:hypothetical protein